MVTVAIAGLLQKLLWVRSGQISTAWASVPARTHAFSHNSARKPCPAPPLGMSKCLGALHGGSFPCGVKGQGSSQVITCRWLLGSHCAGAGWESPPSWASAERRRWPAVVLRWAAISPSPHHCRLFSHRTSGHSISDVSPWVLSPWALLNPSLPFSSMSVFPP